MTEVAKRPKRRLDWVDFAKGIAIIGVIISHCLPFGTTMRHFFFSFHMPLFFMLSGYTMTPAKNKQELIFKTKKDIKALLIPVVILTALNYFSYRFMHVGFSIDGLKQETILLVKRLFWGSGVILNGHPNVHMMWFLVSMFGARFLVNSTSVLFKSDKNHFILFFLGCIGILLGANEIYLPFNMDVTFVAVLFVATGMLLKKHRRIIKRWKLPVFMICLGVWLYNLNVGRCIIMDERYYGYGDDLSEFFEAFAACFVVIELCKVLCKRDILKKVFCFLGKNSFVILCVHYLDSLAVLVWKNDSVFLMTIFRLTFVLGISLACIFTRNYIKKAALAKNAAQT